MARDYRGVTTPYFLLRARKNNMSVNRIGIVIKNSVVRKAVDRNFWRRRIKSCFLASPQQGFDFLIIVKFKEKVPSVKIFKTTLCESFLSLSSLL
jgi:ribonuclease P protein component